MDSAWYARGLRRLALSLSAATFVALLLAPGTASAVALGDAYEPDDMSSQATTMAVGDFQDHTLEPAEDRDWIKFDVEEGTFYSIRTSAVDSGYGETDTMLQAWDSEGNSLAFNDDSNGTLWSSLMVPAPYTGTMYVEVVGFSSGITGPYRVTVQAGSGGESVLDVTVRNTSDETLEGIYAWVHYHAPDCIDGDFTTGPDGRVVVAAPMGFDYDLGLLDPSGEYAPRQAYGYVSDMTTEYLNLTMYRTASISGQITDIDDDAPLENMYVWGSYFDGDSGYWEEWDRTDEAGAYSLSNLGPGQYLVGAWDETDNAIRYMEKRYDGTVDLAEDADVEGIDIALEKGGAITGVVTDANTGDGLGECFVRAQNQIDSGYTETEAAGDYVISVPAGDYRVDAGHWGGLYQGSEPTTITVTKGVIEEGVDFALNPEDGVRYLTGVVKDTSGEPLEGIGVFAGAHEFSVDSGYYGSYGLTDADGKFARAVFPGTAYVEAWDPTGMHKGEYYNDTTWPGDQIAVTDADVALDDIVLADAGRVAGSITDAAGEPLAEAYIEVEKWFADSGYGQVAGDWTDDDSYLIGGLDSGYYRIGFGGWSDSGGDMRYEYFDNQVESSAKEIQVVEGETFTANAVLSPGATIEGPATVDSGYAGGGRTFLWREDGEGSWSPVDSGYLESDGAFSFGYLLTGRYKVEFGGPGIDSGFWTGNGVRVAPDMGNGRVLTIEDSVTPLSFTVSPFLGTATGEAPETSCVLESAYSVDSMRSSPVTATLTVSDVDGDFSEGFYKVDGGDVESWTGDSTYEVAVAGHGNHTLSFWAADAGGNLEPVKSTDVMIDAVSPVTTADVSPAPYADGWIAQEATVTLTAVDADTPGGETTRYAIDGGTEADYADPFAVAGTGTHSVTFHSTDALHNTETVKSATVKIDVTAPEVDDLAVDGFSASSVMLTWSGSDEGSGIKHYVVSRNGSVLDTVEGTSFTDTTVGANTDYEYSVTAVDKVDLESSPQSVSIETPTTSYSAPVSGNDPVNINMAGQTVIVDFEDVDTPGVFSLTPVDPPSGHDGTGLVRIGNMSYELSFTGTFTGTVTITLPYDPTLPDARAMNIRVRHRTATGWETITPTVNLTAHTLTFTLNSLSPVVVGEPGPVNTSVRLTSNFKGYGAAVRTINPAYKGSVRLQATVRDTGGNALSHRRVEVQEYKGTRWVSIAVATETATKGVYAYDFAPTAKRTLRMVVKSCSFTAESTGTSYFAVPKTKTVITKAPSRIRAGRTFKVSGYVEPKHTAGSTKVVKLKVYKYSTAKKKYVYKYSRSLKIANSKTYPARSTFSRSLSFSSAGKWKVVAFTSADSGHAATESAAKVIKVIK